MEPDGATAPADAPAPSQPPESSPRHVSRLVLAGVPYDPTAVGEEEGRAVSADPSGADPDEVQVFGRGAPWRIDRRSTRVSEPGDDLDVVLVERVADLVDRAQLVLGFPVEVEWVETAEGLVLRSIQPLELQRQYADGAWRRVALTAADEGVVAPLTIDALDRALRVVDQDQDGPVVGQTVRRIYGRPYRRRKRPSILGRATPMRLVDAARACGRATRTVAPLLTGALRFDRSSEGRFQSLVKDDLARLEPEALLEVLRQRQQFVAEALLQLDRSREATRQALHALEATLGALPTEAYSALAAPRPTRARRKAQQRLAKFADAVHRAGVELGSTQSLPQPLKVEWRAIAEELADVRPLGIDVLPEPIGGSDRALRHALRRVGRDGPAVVETRRKQAKREVLEVASARGIRRAREVLVRPLLVLLDRIAEAKGRLSEGLGRSLVLLRSAAVEVGRRLVDEAILDEPDDALYLGLGELEDALRGEPGAYAARVRVRREDDARWASFDAPRNLR